MPGLPLIWLSRHVNTSLKKLVEGVKTNAKKVEIDEDDLDELVSMPAQL